MKIAKKRSDRKIGSFMPGKQENKIEKKYSPLVEELSGVIKIDDDFDFRKEYTDYLIEKYR